MEKVVEVYATSNLGTKVSIRSEVNQQQDLEDVITYTMYRVKELNTKVEKFNIEGVRTVNLMNGRETV